MPLVYVMSLSCSWPSFVSDAAAEAWMWHEHLYNNRLLSWNRFASTAAREASVFLSDCRMNAALCPHWLHPVRRTDKLLAAPRGQRQLQHHWSLWRRGWARSVAVGGQVFSVCLATDCPWRRMFVLTMLLRQQLGVIFVQCEYKTMEVRLEHQETADEIITYFILLLVGWLCRMQQYMQQMLSLGAD